MPVFFFHLCNGNGFVEDEEGQELSDAPTARTKAVEAMRDLISGEVRNGTLNMSSFIEIEDDHHELIETVTFADAIAVDTQSECTTRPRRS
jgi:hypothetical protein